jgi:hypothetical protein
MRILLLSLAIFYAWLPTGLCACQLQAALFPPATDDPLPCHDDDHHECHCTGAKPACILSAPVNVDDNDLPWTPALPPAVSDQFSATETLAPTLCPFGHAAASPLYLTLRALRI